MTKGSMRRIGLVVHYDGSAYFGWQLQRDERSVQGDLEAVLSRLFDRPARVTGSGRTDRGVHATGQVATVDAPQGWPPARLRRAMNALLPSGIWIAAAADVQPNFHPRYDAVSRSYTYRIGLADASASPFHASWCWPLRRPLNRGPIGDATRALLGDHSFRRFAKAGQEHRGDRCIVHSTEWAEWSDIGLEFRISANRFLHHMVRYLVGTLVDIGLERRPAADVEKLLMGEDDMETSPPAPASGLFLSSVRYPAGAFEPFAADSAEPASLTDKVKD